MNTHLNKTQIIDKNGKATHVYRKDESAQAPGQGRQVPVISLPKSPSYLPVGWTDRDENNADIDDLVQEAVSNGLLRSTRTMNGDRRYETADLYLGRMEDDTRVWVRLSLEHVNKPRTLGDGKTVVEESWDFSMSGYSKQGGREVGGGQNREDVLAVAKDSKLDSQELRELYDIWDDNHLNGMRAGTDKQMAKLAELKEQGFDTSANNYTAVREAVGDDEGYAYGSKWLHNDVPSGVIERAFEILGKTDMSKRRG